jgi:hypothetical protein
MSFLKIALLFKKNKIASVLERRFKKSEKLFSRTKFCNEHLDDGINLIN